jgi:hypothetical protein
VLPAPESAAATSPDAAAATAGHQLQELPPVGVFAAGLLAGGALTLIARRRHSQRQNRRPGRRIPLPAAARAIRAEQRLRARRVLPEHLQPVTLRGAIAHLASAGDQLPGVVGLHVTPELLEVLLDRPASGPPPPPYTVAPGRQGQRWQLPLPVLAPGTGHRGDHGDLLPGLVTVGLTGHGGWLLLNLEALQVTVCEGPPRTVSQVLATFAAELATGQLAGWYDLILAGFPELDSLAADVAGGGGRATRQSCQTIDEAVSLLETRRARLDRLLAGKDPGDLRLRRYDDPDGFDLALLVSRIPASAQQLARIAAATSHGCAAALVAAGEPGRADYASDGYRLDGLGPAAARDTIAGPGRPGGRTEAASDPAPGHTATARFQLTADPQQPGGVSGQIHLPGYAGPAFTVYPEPLGNADYDALVSLFTTATEAGDVDPGEPPYDRLADGSWLASPYSSGTGPGLQDVWPDRTPDPGPAADGLLSEVTSAEQWPPAPAEQDPLTTARAPADTEDPAPGHLHVGVLGPLHMAGSAAGLHPGQAELIVALSLAGEAGLPNSALRTSLGNDPDHQKSSEALRQLIARTRHQLGLAADRREWIEHTGGGQYRMHEAATLDWAQFTELANHAMAEPGSPVARDELRAALALVRGEPFAGCPWWWLDTALIEHARALITDAALMLSGLELTAGNPQGARLAALKGLEADPAAEQLHRAVMRAEDAAGNLAGVLSAWKACLTAIADIAPDGDPHPETVKLYRQLTERPGTREPARARA